MPLRQGGLMTFWAVILLGIYCISLSTFHPPAHMVHASREYSRKPFLRSGNRIAYSRESHFFVLPPNLYLTLLLLYTSCESWLQPVLLHHQPFEYTITLNESSWEMTIHLFRDSLTITFSKKTCQILSIMPSSTTESHSLRASVRACVYFFCGAALQCRNSWDFALFIYAFLNPQKSIGKSEYFVKEWRIKSTNQSIN